MTGHGRQIASPVTALVALSLALGVAPVPTAAAITPMAASSAAKSTAQPTKAVRAKATAATAARIASDYTSIFAGQADQLANIGWSTCDGPITWSTDTRALSTTQARRQRATLTRAFADWSAASGLTFQYAGEVPVSYNDSAYVTVPVDGSQRAHHIYVGFASDASSPLITSTNPGFGGPAAVSTAVNHIDGGYAFFSTDYVTSLTGKQAGAKAENLYLHEIGHALGLGHASQRANVMYGIVAAKTSLGAGDVNGVRSFTKPCTV